jgi:hypothetical protein
MLGNTPYYQEILILVDGWPWNLSEYDFRSWFAPGSCPRALEPTEIAGEIWTGKSERRVSGNRRVKGRKGRDRRKKKAA